MHILELLAQNDIMEEQEVMALTRAYTTLRDELHHLALQGLPGHVSEDYFTAERGLVRANWQKWLMEERSMVLSRANFESLRRQE